MKVLKYLSQRIPLELGETSITFSTATNKKNSVFKASQNNSQAQKRD